VVTLEGIEKQDRAAVFGSTTIRSDRREILDGTVGPKPGQT
jgi:hypothetical protein